MGSLAGPRSIAISEQLGHTFLDMNLSCGRCHNHPLDGRVGQEDYWQFTAAFETGLQWSVDADGAVRIDSVVDQELEPRVVFYETIDGRQRVAMAGVPGKWLGAGLKENTVDTFDQSSVVAASEIARLADSMAGSPQLASRR